jgi:pimeloyl-ACP methyl ester carboxylesterase
MVETTIQSVEIPAGRESVAADLETPTRPTGLVIFAHGSGSSRHSPRNRAVAQAFHADRLATLLADLLTPGEEARDRVDGRYRFDIELLGRRLVRSIDWVRSQPTLRSLPLGLFGASTGAGAALVAAAARPGEIRAIVSRGGRPDLAGAALPSVHAPTLLLVGGLDHQVIDVNEWARRRMRCPVRLEIVPGASHLFEEPGTLDRVAVAARQWFLRHLPPDAADGPIEQAG